MRYASALMILGCAAFAAWLLLRDENLRPEVGGTGRAAEAPADAPDVEPFGGAIRREAFRDEPPPDDAESRPDGAASRPAPGIGLTGIVVDEAGAGLSAAVVEVFAATQWSFEDYDLPAAVEKIVSPPKPLRVGATDSGGLFRFADLPPGVYRLIGAKSGLRTTLSDAMTLSFAADPPQIRLVLGKARVQKGRVVDRAGAPVVARVAWFPEGPEFVAAPAARERATDAEGRFVLDDLWPGDYSLTVRAEGFPVTVRTLPPTAVADLVVTLDRSAGVSGRVVDATTGAPLSDVRLVVLNLGGDGLGGCGVARSSADGAFAIRPGPVGDQIVLIASKPGYLLLAEPPAQNEERAWFGDGATPLGAMTTGTSVERELRLVGGGAVVGRVVDAETGEGVPGVALRLRAADTLLLSGPRREQATSDATGAFRFPLVGGGMFRVVAEKEGYFQHPLGNGETDPEAPQDGPDDAQTEEPPEEPSTYQAPPAGGELAGVVVKLRRGATVEGRVVDEDDRPVARATVAWRVAGTEGEAETNAVPDARRRTTDAEGKFSFAGVPPGRFHFRAAHPRFAAGGAVEARVATQKPAEPLKIVVAAGAELGGRVRYADGRPAHGVVLQFVPKNPLRRSDRPVLDATEFRAEADANGRFAFRGLPYGPGRIGLHWLSQRIWNGAASEDAEASAEWVVLRLVGGDEVEVARADNAPLDLRLAPQLEIEGYAFDESGRPLQHASITAEAADVAEDFNADPFTARWSGSDTDENGRFVLRGLDDRNYRLVAHHQEELPADAVAPPPIPDAPADGASTHPPVPPPPNLKSRSATVESVAAGARGVKLVLKP